MVALKGPAREAQAEQVVLERMMEIAATQHGVQEGYTPDPEIAEAVKKLLGYLQPVVALITTMVPPIKESKLREKRGWEELAQATSMVLIVSIFVRLNLHQVTADCISNGLFLISFFRVT